MRMLLLSLALRSSLRSSWLPRLLGYGGGWPTCSGCEVEEALPGENFIDDDGCSRHFSFLKASSLALFPSPPSTQIPREISDPGFPVSDGVDVSTPFPPWGHLLGFLLLRVDSPLAASSPPRLRSLAGHCPWRLEWSLLGHPGVASAARCPSTSAAVHRCRALRSRWCVVFWLRRRTPVSPHELGYPTPFVRASDVPLRVAVMVPVFFSLGLVVVHCQWWNKLLSGACYLRCRPPGVSVWFCCQPSPPFCFLSSSFGLPLEALPCYFLLCLCALTCICTDCQVTFELEYNKWWVFWPPINLE